MEGKTAYTRLQALGRGAMGTVFLVRRNADGVQLALKTVASESPRASYMRCF